MKTEKSLGYGKIFAFWNPLAMTWLMMAVEGPIIAAIVARLAEPKINLAAQGVAISIAIIVESPIIMIISASTALGRDRASFRRLRNFTYFLNAAITLIMAGLVFTPAISFVTRNLIDLHEDVALLAENSLAIMLPWPAAIGYRRFYQGVLIRDGKTRRVAYGTVVRLVSIAAASLSLFALSDLPGAYIGATALSIGVTMEAIATRIMAAATVRTLLDTPPTGEPIRYLEIGRFYFPLAITSAIELAVHPMVSFFLGHSRMPLESLAVFPVVGSLTFLFRALGLSFQEAAIALMGERNEHYEPLRNFAWLAGISCSVCLAAIAYTPLSGLWFGKVSGLSADMTHLAAAPTMIMCLLPLISWLMSFQRAVLVNSGRTRPVSVATVIEVACAAALLYAAIDLFDMIGAVAAAVALTIGKTVHCSYLTIPTKRAIRISEKSVHASSSDEGGPAGSSRTAVSS